MAKLDSIKSISVNGKLLSKEQINKVFEDKGFYHVDNINNVNVKIEFKGESIPSGIFKDIDSIVDVKIPESIKEIGNNAFDGTSLEIDNLKVIHAINPNAIQDKKDMVAATIEVENITSQKNELVYTLESKQNEYNHLEDGYKKSAIEAEINLLEFKNQYLDQILSNAKNVLDKEIQIVEALKTVKQTQNGVNTEVTVEKATENLQTAINEKESLVEEINNNDLSDMISRLEELQQTADEATKLLEKYLSEQGDKDEDQVHSTVDVETKQYWYVGVTDPTTLSINQTKSKLDAWNSTLSNIKELYVHAEDPKINDYTWYVAVPTSWGITKMWDMVGTTEIDNSEYDIIKYMINNINYTIFIYNIPTDSIYNYFK